MERYLCLDIGDKRIGIAVSDPFNSYALPVCTYNRKNLRSDLEGIKNIIKEKSVTAVVCGLPVNFDGTPSIQTQKAEYFIQKLTEVVNVKIYKVDERCSTCEAEETLIEQGKSIKERKQVIDALAAKSILDGFLNELNYKKQKINDQKENIMSDKEKDLQLAEEFEEDIVELTTDDGKKLKFYFVGTIEYKGKNYSAFEPAEEIDGISEDDLIIFELSGDDEETADLLPIEDEALLDEVFEEFCRVLDEEEAEYEED